MQNTIVGGEDAIRAAHELLSLRRRGDPAVPELRLEQIEQQLGLAVDRVICEGGLYDRELAALAIRQAQGDLVEAIALLRTARTALRRFGRSEPVEPDAMLAAESWEVIEIRRRTIGYVSQFLRIIPRVPTLEIVAEPALELGVSGAEAEARAQSLLTTLRIPERLWSLAPATLSGGEQQRVNIARGFIAGHSILLLDEPTASLDAANRATVVELINEAKARGAAIVGIFHDEEVRAAVAERLFEVSAARA